MTDQQWEILDVAVSGLRKGRRSKTCNVNGCLPRVQRQGRHDRIEMHPQTKVVNRNDAQRASPTALIHSLDGRRKVLFKWMVVEGMRSLIPYYSARRQKWR